MTQILKINKYKPQLSKIKKAAEIIKKGGIVAFPTETVYGLGADAFNVEAIKKIFIAKKRPLDNPLIVHVADRSDVKVLAAHLNSNARLLMDRFWPGPLTIILKKKKSVPDEVTAHSMTVAVRMPASNIALSLIRESGVPLVAPSANLSTRPSPTSANDVISDLSGRVDMIIDGGACDIGIESTVIDMTVSPPVILRCGGLPAEAIESVIGRVKFISAAMTKKGGPVKSPGMKYRHYAPNAVLILAEDSDDYRQKIQDIIDNAVKEGKKVGVLTFDSSSVYKNCIKKFAGSNSRTVARNLFGILRWFDAKGVDLIISESYPEKTGLGAGIRERLKKAATPKYQ